MLTIIKIIKMKELLEIQATKALVGKKIVSVGYMSAQDAKNMGWFHRPLIIFFEDGTHMYASSDDEGNDAGAIFTNIKGFETIPVL